MLFEEMVDLRVRISTIPLGRWDVIALRIVGINQSSLAGDRKDRTSCIRLGFRSWRTGVRNRPSAIFGG